MTREQALEEIKRDEQNIEELKIARKEAWEKGDRREYDMIQSDIRDLNAGIKAIKVAYLGEEE